MSHPAAALTTTDGFPTFVLRSAALEIRVVPALGAKIISLRDLRSGREWLAPAPDGRPLATHPPDTDFALGPLTGCDECFPTVAACAVDERDLPDHGSAWTSAWRVDASAWAAGRLRTTVNLEDDAFHLERELTLEHDTVRLAYRLTNRSPHPLRCLWALHPILARHDGDRIELPPEVARVRVGITFNLDLPLAADDTTEWPSPAAFAGLDFSVLSELPRPWFAKLFTPMLASGQAALANPGTGARLTFAFDPAQVPALAIWITRGGWNGCDHLALEPTTYPADAPALLSPAARTHAPAVPVLAPGETRQWWVTLRSESAPGPKLAPLAPTRNRP